MKESTLRTFQIAASFVLILGAPALTRAANYSYEPESGALRVSYSDLDLGSSEGIAVLYARLQSAARLACDTGSYQRKGSLKAALSADACYDDLLTKVVAKVHNDRLSAIHET